MNIGNGFLPLLTAERVRSALNVTDPWKRNIHTHTHIYIYIYIYKINKYNKYNIYIRVTRFLLAHSGTIASPKSRGWGLRREYGYPKGARGHFPLSQFLHILLNLSL